jgi:hypothetical protein
MECKYSMEFPWNVHGFHVEYVGSIWNVSMESMWNGYIPWIPHGIGNYIPCGFHGMIPLGFHVDSMWNGGLGRILEF